MMFTFTLEVEIDANDGRDAREIELAIAEDLLCWPAVISVDGDDPKESK